MTKIGLRELSRHTAQYARRAGAGEQIIVTDRDQPLMMLVPIPSVGSEYLDQLIASGQAMAPTEPGGVQAVLTVTPEPHSPSDAAELIAELREERL